MSKNTKLLLEAALERILSGQPKRIPSTRKLSVRAVEEEANLGNGSGYYYPEFVDNVKQAKAKLSAGKQGSPFQRDTDKLKEKLKQETRVKNKYKSERDELKKRVSQLTAEHHHFNDVLRKALTKIDELESENNRLREENSKLRRNSISSIK
ncbi:hypothetical protein ACPV34_06755 [Photobacterium damselae]|uniref:hypothetical protein n=1 Tax=Photobacterium damselae TaxID=38293 RepID=UPI004067914F